MTTTTTAPTTCQARIRGDVMRGWYIRCDKQEHDAGDVTCEQNLHDAIDAVLDLLTPHELHDVCGFWCHDMEAPAMRARLAAELFTQLWYRH